MRGSYMRVHAVTGNTTMTASDGSDLFLQLAVGRMLWSTISPQTRSSVSARSTSRPAPYPASVASSAVVLTRLAPPPTPRQRDCSTLRWSWREYVGLDQVIDMRLSSKRLLIRYCSSLRDEQYAQSAGHGHAVRTLVLRSADVADLQQWHDALTLFVDEHRRLRPRITRT